MVTIDFALRQHSIEDLLKDLSKARVSKESELRHFYLWGSSVITVDGTGLVRPPAWEEECRNTNCGPEDGLVDFFLGMGEALARLDWLDEAEEKYYFVEHDFSITLTRRGGRLLLAATLEMGDYPSTPPLTAGFEEFCTALACAAKRFRATLAPWDNILLGYTVVSNVLSQIDRLADRCVLHD